MPQKNYLNKYIKALICALLIASLNGCEVAEDSLEALDTPSADAKADLSADTNADADAATHNPDADTRQEQTTDCSWSCTAPDPSETCEHIGCPSGLTCQPDPAGGCVPSSCFCDNNDATWKCDTDCAPAMKCALPPAEPTADEPPAEALPPTDETGDEATPTDPSEEEGKCQPWPVICDSDAECPKGLSCDPQPWDAPDCCRCRADGHWACDEGCALTTGCRLPLSNL
jgi:hypothetical protein